jgi:hypothetical protein
MNRIGALLTVALALTLTAGLAFASDGEDNLAAPLQSFGPLLGKTWKGEFKDSTPEKPLIDVARWERALNGQAIRVLHSVNDGVYGGETLITWDAKKKTLGYWYFTTAGFRTEGIMKHEGGQWIGHETVEGAVGGITEVKSTTELLPDGRLQVKAEYLKNGKWGEAREVTYKLAPEAKVIFK